MATIEHVSATTMDGTVRGTAAGLLVSAGNFKLILSLLLLTSVLEAINIVSESLQSPSVDIIAAQCQLEALITELGRLCCNDSFNSALAKAETLVHKLAIETDMPMVSVKKLPRRIDDNPLNAAARLSQKDQIKVDLYFTIIDRLVMEIRQRFPQELWEFGYLDSRHFADANAEEGAHHMATCYAMDADTTVCQWRLSHHFLKAGTSLQETYRTLPEMYSQLYYLYKVILTLPVTTASVERSFSKLSFIKNNCVQQWDKFTFKHFYWLLLKRTICCSYRTLT